MAACNTFRRWCSVAVQNKGSRWERLRNSRLGSWCSSLLSDYRQACREVIIGAWERPVKASVYLGLIGGVWACYSTNPNDASFETTLLETANKLGLLSPWIRSGSSNSYVQGLLQLRNQGRLQYLSLGVASLAYCLDHEPLSSLYEARCSPLSTPWSKLTECIIDIGFAGRWWVLEARMKDYDVNEEEFKHLTAALTATVPPSTRETEKNEQQHKDSWKALEMMPDDISEAEQEEKDRDVAGRTHL